MLLLLTLGTTELYDKAPSEFPLWDLDIVQAICQHVLKVYLKHYMSAKTRIVCTSMYIENKNEI